MIVDIKGNTVDVTIIFEKPLNDYLKEQLDYILDTISELEADYDFENQISFRSDQPLPSMILAIMPQMVTQDR